MRKVEQAMIAVIRAGIRAPEPFAGVRRSVGGNTVVEFPATGKHWRVYLHGHLIANGGTDSMSFTLAGWNTPTTRSRVNALLDTFGSGRVHTVRFVPHYNGSAIDSRQWVAVGPPLRDAPFAPNATFGN